MGYDLVAFPASHFKRQKERNDRDEVFDESPISSIALEYIEGVDRNDGYPIFDELGMSGEKVNPNKVVDVETLEKAIKGLENRFRIASQDNSGIGSKEAWKSRDARATVEFLGQCAGYAQWKQEKGIVFDIW